MCDRKDSEVANLCVKVNEFKQGSIKWFKLECRSCRRVNHRSHYRSEVKI